MARTDLNALGVFAALFTELHVTRAASRLGVTQSAVSHALRNLRARFDDELFERTARGLKPTRRAMQLAPRIIEAVQAAEDVFQLRQGAIPPVPRALHVSMSDYGVAVFLRGLSHWLSCEHDSVNLRVSNRSRAEALAEVEERKLDMAIGVFPSLDHGRLRQALLLQDPFVTVAWKENPRVSKGLTLSTFVELPHVLVSVGGEARGTVDESLERRGLRRRVALAVPSFILAPELVIGTDRLLTITSTALALRPELADQLAVFKPPVDLPLTDIVAVTHARSDADTLVQDCCKTLALTGRQAVAQGRSLGRRLRPAGKSR
ncbi:MAG: LysR family transcriptional regulator [Burkholderiaceae bacterium]|nr:LysR family transcriptional regulator [Burkholderiaceae bacterium]